MLIKIMVSQAAMLKALLLSLDYENDGFLFDMVNENVEIALVYQR